MGWVTDQEERETHPAGWVLEQPSTLRLLLEKNDSVIDVSDVPLHDIWSNIEQ